MAWLGHFLPGPHAMADAQDRNLPATPKKIRKAREDGQVARSRDLAHLLVVGGGGALLAAGVPMLGDWLHRLLVTGLRFDARLLARDDAMTNRLAELTWAWMMVLLPLGAASLALALGASLASGGWNLPQAAAAKLRQVEPADGPGPHGLGPAPG